MRSLTAKVCVGLLLIGGFAAAGCQSARSPGAAVDRRVSTVASIEDLRQDLRASDAQILVTQQSLERLTAGQTSDLERNYRDFRSEVRKSQQLHSRINSRSDALIRESDRKVRLWNEQVATIDSPTLRERSQQRATEARRQHEQMVADLNQLRQANANYIQRLQDIETYVAQDLTPAGIRSMGDHPSRVVDAADQLRSRARQLDGRLAQVAQAWSTEPPLHDGRAQRAGARLDDDWTTPANRPVDASGSDFDPR